MTGGHFEVHGLGPVRLVPLSPDTFTIGRAPGNEVAVESPLVSRLHALVERLPPGWIIRDLGSTNGTTVNGVPLREARTLHDGDRVEIGPARLVFRAPAQLSGVRTVGVAPPPAPPALTRRERELLDLLCRPYLAGAGAFPEPPTVRALAGTLGVSESAVKKHLTRLYDKFDLVSNDDRRRSRLAAEAVRRGAVG